MSDLNSDNVGQAIIGLERIRHRLYKVERATGRKKTPGRAEQITKADDLSGWDATALRMARAVGVELSIIAMRARAAVNVKLDAWD